MRRPTYADFKNSECGYSFAEYLGINVPSFLYRGDGCVMMHRYGGLGVAIEGAYCKTKKEAKASYKAALAARNHRA